MAPKVVEKFLLMPIVKDKFKRVFRFYFKEELEFFELLRRGALGTKVEFPPKDEAALKRLVEMVTKEEIMIAEIGSWTGCSTSVLAKAVANYNGKVFAIDHWMGDEGVTLHHLTEVIDVYSVFRYNMIKLEICNIVYPLVMSSQIASQIFANEILDLVFIDADHRYECVKNDIEIWLPKVKRGGILCGHDCEKHYLEYSKEDRKIIDEYFRDAYIPSIQCHGGVVKAVYDYFRDKYQIVSDSSIWYHIKE